MNLPRLGGLDVIRRTIAMDLDIPVLVLTARDGLDDRVAGLDAGADDYMTKPFEMAELCARVRALGRRRGKRGQMVETIGGLSFDRAGRRLSGPDGVIELSRRSWPCGRRCSTTPNAWSRNRPCATASTAPARTWT